MTSQDKTVEDPIAAPATNVGARAHLFNSNTAGAYEEVVALGSAAVAARVAAAEQPFTGITPDLLAPEIAAVDLDSPLGDTATALAELDRLYLRDAVYFHHPRYLAHLNCPVAIPALLGEAVLSAVNSSVDTWDQSAGATLIERRLIDWTAGRIGFGVDADGVFTSGGTQSNLQALLMAREETFARAGAVDSQARAALLYRLRVLVSGAGHFSITKAAKLLGLPLEALVTVATDADYRMDPVALREQLQRMRAEGLTVMAVAATAGTTDFGTVDPLAYVAEVCEESGVWLHVDAAYGCGLLVSPTRRHLLNGIERADSVTVDYHKSFFQPVSSSAVVVRDGGTLAHAKHHADYLNPARLVEQRIPNQVDKSLQTTRRFDALKLWLTLRIMGAEGIGRLFDEVVDRAASAHELLATDPRFEVVTRSQLSTVVFRYRPDEAVPAILVDEANLHAREALAACGEGMVAATKVAGRHFLKFTLLNPDTTVQDIAQVVGLLAAHAADYVEVTSANGR